jgi:hypothetical protein
MSVQDTVVIGFRRSEFDRLLAEDGELRKQAVSSLMARRFHSPSDDRPMPCSAAPARSIAIPHRLNRTATFKSKAKLAAC